jgi:microcystin-dependent protein
MSSIQGRTIVQLTAATSVQDTDLLYVNRPSQSDATKKDMQATVGLLASQIANDVIKDDASIGVLNKVYSVDKIISLIKLIQPQIGEIKYCTQSPGVNWLPCNGSIYNKVDYPELFNIFFNSFGGDGLATFAVPDLKGRSLMASGKGVGLSLNRSFGVYYGAENVKIVSGNLPFGTPSVGTGTNYAGVQCSSVVGATTGVQTITPSCVAGDFYICGKVVF